MEPSPRSGHGRTRLIVGALLIAAPWLWFAVRGLGPAMDAAAVLLPMIGLAALVASGVIAALLRRWLPLVVGLSFFAVALVATIGPRLPQSSGTPRPQITLAMANVYQGNPTPTAAAAALNGRRVDILATVEMGSGFWDGLRAHTTLPYSVSVGQLGVGSRWPLTLLSRDGFPRTRLIRVAVADPQRPFILYVMHELNPLRILSTFKEQRAFTRRVLTAATAETLPVVAVGDFNTSDRTVSYRLLDGVMRDAMRADASPVSTYSDGWWATLFLRIDHAFIPSDWCAANGSTFSVPGSDHHGIQVSLGPCA